MPILQLHDFLHLQSYNVVKMFKPFFFCDLTTGAGGYSYLYEPLWWAGMITSGYSTVAVIYFSSKFDSLVNIVGFFAVNSTLDTRMCGDLS